MSAAQVFDWLLDKYEHLKVAESTVRSYVRELRKTYDIPKETLPRDYEAVPEAPLGAQMQVDFGETTQQTNDHRKAKLYCISFVLSHRSEERRVGRKCKTKEGTAEGKRCEECGKN